MWIFLGQGPGSGRVIPSSLCSPEAGKLSPLARSRLEPQSEEFIWFRGFGFLDPLDGFSWDAGVPGPGGLFGKMVELSVIKRLGGAEGTTERCHRNHSSLELCPSAHCCLSCRAGRWLFPAELLGCCSLAAVPRICWQCSAGVLQPAVLLPRVLVPASPCVEPGEIFLSREDLSCPARRRGWRGAGAGLGELLGCGHWGGAPWLPLVHQSRAGSWILCLQRELWALGALRGEGRGRQVLRCGYRQGGSVLLSRQGEHGSAPGIWGREQQCQGHGMLPA